MSYKKLCVFLLILAMASMENAAACRYIGCGPWENPANWDCPIPPRLPGPNDPVRINDNCTVTVSSAVPTVNQIHIGVDESGTLHILSGGVVTTLSWVGVGVAGACTGTLNIDAGGAMNIGGHLWVASGGVGNVGIANISGVINVAGIIGIGTIDAVNPSGGIGTVNVLDGGLLALSNIHGAGTSIQPGSVMDITGSGLVTLPGDFEAVIGLYVTAGKITAYGGAGTVVITVIYDGMGVPLQTNTTAIPPTLTVLAPNGGEVLIAGDIYPISWSSIGSISNVLIEYSVDNGSAWTPVDPCNTGNTGSYNWLVPDVNSEQCLMWVVDANDPNVNDTSDAAFTIYKCTLTTDLTGDCVVNLYDLAALTADWLKCGNPFDPDCGVP